LHINWKLLSGYLTILVVVGVSADTFRWRDLEGRVHFGDTPPPGVIAEKIDLHAQPSKLTPEQAQGEVQRLRAISNAQSDATAAEKKRKAEAASKLANETAAHAQRCASARWALTALESGRPVYRDSEGMYRIKRPPGQGDAYTGERQYLDEAKRIQEIAVQRKAVTEACGALPTPDEKRRTEDQMKTAENCEAAAADLNKLEQPDSHAAPEHTAALRGYLANYCRH
jgi:hypothetical protein